MKCKHCGKEMEIALDTPLGINMYNNSFVCICAEGVICKCYKDNWTVVFKDKGVDSLIEQKQELFDLYKQYDYLQAEYTRTNSAWRLFKEYDIINKEEIERLNQIIRELEYRIQSLEK